MGGVRTNLVEVKVPNKRGLYRVDLFIRNRKGVFLRRVSRYLVEVDRFVDVRLDTDRAVYSPGEVVRSEIENIGTAEINVQSLFGIEREVDGKWVSFGGGALGAEFEAMGGGSIGSCASFRLPKDAPPGRYRASHEVGAGPDLEFDIDLTAPFEVK